MGGPLGCLFGFILVLFSFVGIVFLAIVGIGKSWFHAIKTKGKQKPSSENARSGATQQQKKASRQKVFSDDEGEYVDFEELK